MAAALFRRGTGLCCIHREVCRLVWRPQTALFSSKPSDRKQPRRTHIKKAKPQPAVDIAKLLEQLFPQRRPSTAPPAGKEQRMQDVLNYQAQPASSVPTKRPTSSNVPPLSKTEPAASSVKQVDAHRPPAVTVPTTSGSSPTSATSASSASGAAAIESPTIEANVETAPEPVELKTAAQLPSSDHVVETIAETSSSPSAAVEPSIETTIESPVEQILSHPVEPTVEAPAEEVQTESGDVSYSAKVEPSIETTIEPAVEAGRCTEGTLETRAAVVEGPVESPIDVTVDVAAREVETNSIDSGGVDISHTTTVEPLIETTIEPASEKSTSLLETLENRSTVAEESVETTIESEADTAAPSVLTNSTDSGPVNLSHPAEVEPSIETTIELPVEASHCTEGTLETRAAVVEGPVESPIDVTVDVAAREVETNSTDSGPVYLSHTAEVEPLIETTIEPAVEASPVSAIETEAADNLSHSALIQNAEESSIEPPVESVNVAAEEGLNGSEEVTVELVTLHVDELLQTNSTLDEKVREPSVQTENSREDGSETSTEVLSKWDSVLEDLHESEGESDMLVKELLCGVPPNVPGSVGTSSAVDPAVGGQTEEKAAMSLESITLAEVKAAVGGLEAEVLLETRNALEEEAEVLAKEEKMEVGTTADEEAVFEETSEAEFLTLDSISEATDAIEAEAAVVMEAMLGSERGPRRPRDDARGAEKEAEVEQLADVLEATSLESVTLAEVQASSGPPESESLSETTSRLEKEAGCVAGEEKTTEVEDAVPSEEETEASSLAAAEAEALSGGALDDLDPVQRLFLEKIKEYNNMRRSNGGPLEAEPDYEKYLSEETTKLRRLYGGGDLSSFPQFTFTEPQLDQDSK
ncbi:uro-adherence factor A-like isoform X2 [Cebidichthys violaceus]|uniref:uro-adherence factor A-like isoform X2 n=1 Tax=Cebidichthys violaceus TaxID=271503 RepID=UPI0035CBF07B